MVIFYLVCFHQYSNHLEADLLEQEQPGFEPKTSEFKTNHSTIEPSQLLYEYFVTIFKNSTDVEKEDRE